MAEGCPEGIDFDFFKWVLTYNKKIRPNILTKLKSYKDKKIIIFNNRKDIKDFIKSNS